MIDPAGIRKQAEKWWPQVLAAGLQEEEVFPKAVSRIGKVKPSERLRDYERIRRQQDDLIAYSKAQQTYGYTLHWKEAVFRNVGKNRFIDAITFESLTDYLAYLRRKTVYERLLADAELIRAVVPQLTTWCIEHPLLIEQYHGEWRDLLRVVRYFLDAHQWDTHYVRELPIAIPTKFIENHRRVLSSLFDAVLPPERIKREYTPGRQFAQRYGLRYQEPLLRLRILDQSIASTYFSGCNDLSLPLRDFTRLDLPLKRLFILENKTSFSNLMNFLTLPMLPAAAGLFGSGFKINLLKAVPWLQELELYYWGDIDAHGLQILAQLRGYFPHVQPFLMDRTTFDAFPAYHTHAPRSTASKLATLTPAEQALFEDLNTKQLRLEQEHIPQAYVGMVLEEMLGIN